MAQCPKIVERYVVVTQTNQNKFSVDNYANTYNSGTVVNILNCFGKPDYVLRGPSKFTCQNDGTWSPTPPTECTYAPQNSGTTMELGLGEADSIQMLPLMITVGVLALLALAFALILLIVNVNHKGGRSCCGKGGKAAGDDYFRSNYNDTAAALRRPGPDALSNASTLPDSASARYPTAPPQTESMRRTPLTPELSAYEHDRYGGYDNRGFTGNYSNNNYSKPYSQSTYDKVHNPSTSGYHSQSGRSQSRVSKGTYSNPREDQPPSVGRLPRPKHFSPSGRDSLASAYGPEGAPPVSYYSGRPQDRALFASRTPQRPGNRSWHELFYHGQDEQRY